MSEPCSKSSWYDKLTTRPALPLSESRRRLGLAVGLAQGATVHHKEDLMSRLHRNQRRTLLRGLAAAAALPVLGIPAARAQPGPLKITIGWPFATGVAGIEDLAKRFSEEK